MISLIDVSKSYNIENKKVNILDNVNYVFLNGKFYVIKGHSGSGKTTLIELIGQVLSLDAGRIIIDDIDTSNISSLVKAEILREKIGFVFQNYNLNERMNALENVMLPLLINKKIGKERRKDRAIKLLESVMMEDRMFSYPSSLSGGEQQRVAIARALANNPKYILADEPTGNLDKKNEENVLSILKNLCKKGKSIILVFHSDVASKYADILLELNNGKLRECKK